MSSRSRDFEKRQEVDRQLHAEWKVTADADPFGLGDPKKFKAVFQRVKPLINKTVTRYARNTQIPREALEVEASNRAAEALRKYDPVSYPGIHMIGHTARYLMKLNEMTTKYQNMARVVSRDARLIGPLGRAEASLRDIMGVQPTDAQLAEHMMVVTPVMDRKPIPWKPEYVQRIREVQRKDLVSGEFPDSPTSANMDRESEQTFAQFLRFELKPQEQEVLDHMYGLNGKTQMRLNKEIAHALGAKESAISRRVASIMDKWKQHRP
jgi:RNA polymerase sigma factor (sigma-70 family)